MKIKNKMVDLNNALFEQLERLNDESLKGEELTAEINRAGAMCQISTQIVCAAKVVVDAAKIQQNSGDMNVHIPEYIGVGDEKDNR